jgi:hypothetical protein
MQSVIAGWPFLGITTNMPMDCQAVKVVAFMTESRSQRANLAVRNIGFSLLQEAQAT